MYKNNLTNISSLNKISTTESIKSGKKSNYNSKIISDYSQNISLSSSKILSNSKSRKDYNENNESVLLTSIFTLPKISSSHKFLNHDLPKKKQIRLRKRNNI
jgi:Zn-dependent metalloprotease